MKRKSLLSVLLIIAILLGSFNLSLAVGIDNLTKYNMELVLNDEAHTVEGKMNVQFVNTYNDELNELVFHLYADSYESYETLPSIGGIYIQPGEELPELQDKQKGYIEIKNVSVDGKEVKFTEGNQILKVKLKDSVKSGEKANIDIKFLLKIPEGYHRLHYMNGVYSLTNWYPILSIYDEKSDKWDENPYYPIGESNYSDVSNYTVKITVPKDMILAPTGKIVKEMVYDEYKVVTIVAEKVRDFVILMSPNYKVKTKEADGIKIISYYLEDEYSTNEETAEILLEEVVKTVKFMNKTFGRYPYDELKIAETYLSGGAMEYPQVIQMGRIVLFEDVNLEESAPWLVEAAVHETVHQWWYVGVGNDEFNEPFLDESLTVFTTAYFFEKEYGEYHENGVKATIRRYIYPTTICSLNSSVDEFSDWGEYSNVIYSIAPAFFEDLRQKVGEDKFIEILRTYYERYLFKNAAIDDLLELIGEVAGEEVHKAMYQAVSKPNYYPENIRLTPEDESIFNIRWEKRRLKDFEEQNGLIIGSIVLRVLEGEDLIIVRPKYINERDVYSVDSLIDSITTSFKYSYGIDLEIIAEDELTEDQKKNNLIVIGYPEKSRIIREISPNLPINLRADTIEINKVSIKNDGVSGMFISENPYNNKSLSLIIFLSDKDMSDISNIGKVEVIAAGDSQVTYVYEDFTMYKYNPLYVNNNIQFIIDVDGIEINGMYK